MYIFHKTKDLQTFLNKYRKLGKSIGYVPTMGALHQGHISLITASKRDNDITVCSIFVNPTQFNNAEDLIKYPKTIDADILKLELAQSNVLFLPEVTEMYPNGLDAVEHYELGNVEKVLEGEFRPRHFQGVAQIVDRFLTIIQPNHLYMGQKDYQQCAVIAQLLDVKNHNTQLHIASIIREADGLAMSSRNSRLSDTDRQRSNIIYQCLVSIQAQNGIKSFEQARKENWELLERKQIIPEYVSLRNAKTLEELEDYDNTQEMVLLIAAYVGSIRLIDNLVI